MMISFATAVDINRLFLEIKDIKYSLDGSGALMFVPQSNRLSDFHGFPTVMAAIHEIQRVRIFPAIYAMINVLPPGVDVPIHTDTLKASPRQGERPRLERWHLPIVTNDGCRWWDKINDHVTMPAGMWVGPLPYWEDHKVYNLGDSARYHLIVDLDTPRVDH